MVRMKFVRNELLQTLKESSCLDGRVLNRNTQVEGRPGWGFHPFSCNSNSILRIKQKRLIRCNLVVTLLDIYAHAKWSFRRIYPQAMCKVLDMRCNRIEGLKEDLKTTRLTANVGGKILIVSLSSYARVK